MIDLHSHTNESDGSLSPSELVQAAVDARLEVLAITDHDTFAGYDLAVAPAREARLDLICGIELSTLHHVGNSRKTVHLLGYFFDSPPARAFRAFLAELHAARRDRNERLSAKLEAMGVQVSVDEVEAAGRSIAGRPHFARLMVEKGYVRSIQEAFNQYIGEAGKAFVERQGPGIIEGIHRVRDAGGLASLAHPVRLGFRKPDDEERFIADLRAHGLQALEAYHSDHSPQQVERYLGLAQKHDLKVSAGSDFHGDIKPYVSLGMLRTPRDVLDQLRG